MTMRLSSAPRTARDRNPHAIHFPDTNHAENEREGHEEGPDFASGVVEVVEHGLESRRKVRIGFVEVGEGGFRVRFELGKLAISFAADFFGSDSSSA